LLTLHQLGELSQKQLATVLPMDPAALTRQVKSMEQLGWIERYTDVQDNRLTNVALTEAGLAIVEQVLPRRSVFIEKAFSDFSLDEMETLSRLLGTLEARLRLGNQGNLDGPDKI
jgi:DNA-binding MarR family transcriptional regulator